MSKLHIHKTQVHDIDTIISMERDNENSQFIVPNSKEGHYNFITDYNVGHLLIKSENHEIIGFVILVGLKNKNKSIEFRRIVIRDKGKGYGRMTIKEIKKYCFEKLNCHRIWLDVLTTNERAKYLYYSEGFRKEGVLRESVLIKNKFNSVIIMAILEDDYKNSLAVG